MTCVVIVSIAPKPNSVSSKAASQYAVIAPSRSKLHSLDPQIVVLCCTSTAPQVTAITDRVLETCATCPLQLGVQLDHGDLGCTNRRKLSVANELNMICQFRSHSMFNCAVEYHWLS